MQNIKLIHSRTKFICLRAFTRELQSNALPTKQRKTNFQIRTVLELTIHIRSLFSDIAPIVTEFQLSSRMQRLCYISVALVAILATVRQTAFGTGQLTTFRQLSCNVNAPETDGNSTSSVMSCCRLCRKDPDCSVVHFNKDTSSCLADTVQAYTLVEDPSSNNSWISFLRDEVHLLLFIKCMLSQRWYWYLDMCTIQLYNVLRSSSQNLQISGLLQISTIVQF